MCHILLLMPLLGLPLFWIMPLSEALPIYTVIVLFSGLLYWLIWRSMKMSAALGPESIIGTEAEVVARIYQGHLAQYLVRSRGELWSARYNDTLQPGEKVNVADLIGNNLIVKPENSAVSHEQLSTEGENKDRSRFGKKWCH